MPADRSLPVFVCLDVGGDGKRRRANHPPTHQRDLDCGLSIGLHRTPNIGWIAATAQEKASLGGMPEMPSILRMSRLIILPYGMYCAP
jgi:hypothetical protein